MAVCTPLNGLSLCTGGGGLDAALHLVLPDFRVVCACERQAYAAASFVEWMEKTGMGACPVWDDVATFDPLPWRECVDIIAAGYPCQPFSLAGNGLGEYDPRHTWPHIRRIIRAITPLGIFLENVAAHLTNGFDTVKSDLERIGYRVAAGIYSAAEVGAPHLRERLFIYAQLADAARLERQQGRTEPDTGRHDAVTRCGPKLGNADSGKRHGRTRITGREEKGRVTSRGASEAELGQNAWPWPAGRGEEQYEWEEPRLTESGLGRTTHGLGARNEQILMLGNGVVPMAGAMAFVALWHEINR